MFALVIFTSTSVAYAICASGGARGRSKELGASDKR